MWVLFNSVVVLFLAVRQLHQLTQCRCIQDTWYEWRFILQTMFLFKGSITLTCMTIIATMTNDICCLMLYASMTRAICTHVTWHLHPWHMAFVLMTVVLIPHDTVLILHDTLYPWHLSQLHITFLPMTHGICTHTTWYLCLWHVTLYSLHPWQCVHISHDTVPMKHDTYTCTI